MGRNRRHESALFWLSLAGFVALLGFGVIAYEGTRFGPKADPWHHFWFAFGVAGVAVAVGLSGWACFLFARQRWLERQRLSAGGEASKEDTGKLVRETIREFE
jgi:hypothetical protein